MLFPVNFVFKLSHVELSYVYLSWVVLSFPENVQQQSSIYTVNY